MPSFRLGLPLVLLSALILPITNGNRIGADRSSISEQRPPDIKPRLTLSEVVNRRMLANHEHMLPPSPLREYSLQKSQPFEVAPLYYLCASLFGFALALALLIRRLRAVVEEEVEEVEYVNPDDSVDSPSPDATEPNTAANRLSCAGESNVTLPDKLPTDHDSINLAIPTEPIIAFIPDDVASVTTCPPGDCVHATSPPEDLEYISPSCPTIDCLPVPIEEDDDSSSSTLTPLDPDSGMPLARQDLAPDSIVIRRVETGTPDCKVVLNILDFDPNDTLLQVATTKVKYRNPSYEVEFVPGIGREVSTPTSIIPSQLVTETIGDESSYSRLLCTHTHSPRRLRIFLYILGRIAALDQLVLWILLKGIRWRVLLTPSIPTLSI